jgi:DNA-binding CsgD family transcriptional regulator
LAAAPHPSLAPMQGPTPDGYAALTEKEKQTLRLIVRGHDAKSTARHLGLSVHTINERLRDARRKLSVSSSREAARLLFEREGTDPQNLADEQIGEAARQEGVGQDGRPDSGQSGRVARSRTGVVTMSLALGFLAVVAVPQIASAPEGSAASVSARTAEVEAAARRFLTLIDQGNWDESYALTTSTFQRQNTSKVWAGVSEQVRPPLGALVSRTMISHEDVPTPPHGHQVVKFRTNFANKPNVIEKVSLERAGNDWRVAGIYIE